MRPDQPAPHPARAPLAWLIETQPLPPGLRLQPVRRTSSRDTPAPGFPLFVLRRALSVPRPQSGNEPATARARAPRYLPKAHLYDLAPLGNGPLPLAAFASHCTAARSSSTERALHPRRLAIRVTSGTRK